MPQTHRTTTTYNALDKKMWQFLERKDAVVELMNNRRFCQPYDKLNLVSHSYSLVSLLEISKNDISSSELIDHNEIDSLILDIWYVVEGILCTKFTIKIFVTTTPLKNPTLTYHMLCSIKYVSTFL